MTIKKVLGWALVLFLGWYLVTNPHGAAAALGNLTNALKGIGASVVTFMNSMHLGG
jgi:hypothetical protein